MEVEGSAVGAHNRALHALAVSPTDHAFPERRRFVPAGAAGLGQSLHPSTSNLLYTLHDRTVCLEIDKVVGGVGGVGYQSMPARPYYVP